MRPEDYKAVRVANGLTQRQLAQRLGLNYLTVLRRERGGARITREMELALGAAIAEGRREKSFSKKV